MPLLASLLLFVLSVLLAVPAVAQDADPPRGFLPGQWEEQRAIEERFRAVPDPARLREYMEYMAGEPHIAGFGGGSLRVAEYALEKFRSFGLEAEIEETEALMPLPTERFVEVVGPEPYTLRLEELAVAEDPDTSDDGLLPTFNPYAADGDVRGEVVFVNYGIPEDYEMLAELGISVEGKIVLARYGRSWRGIKAKLAQENGAVGALMYSDPEEDGYYQGLTYPEGPYRPEWGVQRGSILDMPVHPGDPLTPGWGGHRGSREADPGDGADPRPDSGAPDLLGRRASDPEAAPGDAGAERRLEGGAPDHLPHRSGTGRSQDAHRLRLAGAADLQRRGADRGLPRARPVDRPREPPRRVVQRGDGPDQRGGPAHGDRARVRANSFAPGSGRGGR